MKVFAVLSAFRPPSYPFPVGGGEMSNRQLFVKLADNGHEVRVYAVNAGEGWDDEQPLSVIDGGFGKASAIGKICHNLKSRLALKNLVRDFQPDVVISSVATMGLATRIAAFCDAPLAVVVRALKDIELRRDSVVRRIAKRIVYGNGDWRGATDLIANSDFLLGACIRAGFKGNGWTVYPPVDSEKSAADWPSRVRTVAMVGSSREKGIDTLVELARRMPEIEFRVIGDRDVPAGSTRSSANLTRVGWTNDPVSEIDLCDALIMPSKVEEAFGRTAVEAILRKKFVLCSQIGGLPEAMGDERLLVAPGDLDAWHERLSQLTADPRVFRGAMSAALVRSGSFSLEEQAALMEQALAGMVLAYKRRRKDG